MFSYIFTKSQQNLYFHIKLVKLSDQHFAKENFSAIKIFTYKLFII